MMMNKYKTLLINPPWNQKTGRKMSGYKVVDGKQIWNSEHSKAETVPYQTMSLDDIKNMPINSLAEKDAFLFCWVTNANLPYVFDIIKTWGFKYSTTIVWAKNKMGGGLGGTFRITTEFLIFAKKGNPKATGIIESTWFNIKRTYVNGVPKNSKKPDYFYDLIEKVTTGPYLEIFARENRLQWDAFGNEVENSININLKPILK